MIKFKFTDTKLNNHFVKNHAQVTESDVQIKATYFPLIFPDMNQYYRIFPDNSRLSLTLCKSDLFKNQTDIYEISANFQESKPLFILWMLTEFHLYSGLSKTRNKINIQNIQTIQLLRLAVLKVETDFVYKISITLEKASLGEWIVSYRCQKNLLRLAIASSSSSSSSSEIHFTAHKGRYKCLRNYRLLKWFLHRLWKDSELH